MTSDATTPKPRRKRTPRASAAVVDVSAVSSAVTAPAPAVSEDGAPIQADHVEVWMGAVGRVDSERLEVDRGAIGAARAGTVDIRQGALGGALADRVSIRQSFARSLIAREAVVEQSVVRTLVAAEVRLQNATGVGILIARKVVGDVRVLLDWRGALAFGAAFGLVAGLVGRIRGPRKGD
jgi:hypothetical protein